MHCDNVVDLLVAFADREPPPREIPADTRRRYREYKQEIFTSLGTETDTPANRETLPAERIAKAVPPAQIGAVVAFLCSNARPARDGAAARAGRCRADQLGNAERLAEGVVERDRRLPACRVVYGT